MNRVRWLVFGFLALAIALGLGLTAGWTLWRILGTAGAPRPVPSATLLTQVQGLAQLVTVKYVLEKVVVIEDVRLHGENRVILVVHGTAKAGVDLGKLRDADIRVNGPRAWVRLPPAELTDVYLDEAETRVLEHKTGLFRRFDKDLQQQARREGLEAVRRAARYNGILDEAESRAEQQLRLFFRNLGVVELEFIRSVPTDL